MFLDLMMCIVYVMVYGGLFGSCLIMLGDELG